MVLTLTIVNNFNIIYQELNEVIIFLNKINKNLTPYSHSTHQYNLKRHPYQYLLRMR